MLNTDRLGPVAVCSVFSLRTVGNKRGAIFVYKRRLVLSKKSVDLSI